MKFAIILIVVLTYAAADFISEKDLWVNFKVEHGKFYRNTVEENFRYSIFQENLKKIQENNEKFERGESSFKMGINHFADMSVEEFKMKLGFQKKVKPEFNKINVQYFVPSNDSQIPDSFDWTKLGAVTGIKDQGSCGSCWSFSTTGTMEGQYFLKTGKLVSLSEQNLVDCDKTCLGCMGGLMDKALEWIEKNGIMSENDYPYVGYDEPCSFHPSKSVTKISSYVYVKPGDEGALEKAVATIGPISVAIDATDAFMFYESGIFYDSSCGNTRWDLNHGVLAVGYGTHNGKDYWIVKNSWGKSWGQEGYIWMSRNAHNQCGIASEPVYPIL